MSQADLEALCARWQRLLRLQDWDIKIRFARRYEMEDAQGDVEWMLASKQALIRVLDPSDWNPSCAWPQDVEATVVHELLHIHLAPIAPKRGTLEHTAMEQAIECIEQALVRLACGQGAEHAGRDGQAVA